MTAGQLTEKIKILQPKSSKNFIGEQVETWEVTEETRAKVIFNSMNRSIENKEIFYSNFRTFEVRSYIKLKSNFRIEWQERRYRILSIEPNKDLQKIIIETELINE